MTPEEIEAEIERQRETICSPHEGAAIAHYLIACRICCLQHFMALERKSEAKRADDNAAELVKASDQRAYAMECDERRMVKAMRAERDAAVKERDEARAELTKEVTTNALTLQAARNRIAGFEAQAAVLREALKDIRRMRAECACSWKASDALESSDAGEAVLEAVRALEDMMSADEREEKTPGSVDLARRKAVAALAKLREKGVS